MRHAPLAALLLLAAPAAAEEAAQAAEEAALAAEARALMQRFGAALKAELSAAIDRGGPPEAIAVCHTRAPEIAAAVSAESGWRVARSSHRLRNPENAPDAYTEAAIADFLAAEAEGRPAAELARSGIVEEEGGRVFRMVKAIPTAKLCLACHGGAQVAPETEAKLAELYPEDRARGFAEGEMRGVFTLAKPLD